MATSNKAIQDWYANRLREHLLARYRAHLAFVDSEGEGDDPEEVCPTSTELSPTGERADRDKAPASVREAYEFYKKHIQDEDIGSVRDCVVPVGRRRTYAVRVRTDGDDGFLEVYDARGRFLAAGRTYLEIVAWGDRDWLRARVKSPADLPPELKGAGERTLWGKPPE